MLPRVTGGGFNVAGKYSCILVVLLPVLVSLHVSVCAVLQTDSNLIIQHQLYMFEPNR